MQLSLKEGGHSWEKLNLMTKADKKGSYDELQCKACGLKGRVYNLTHITIPDSKYKQALDCPNAVKEPVPEWVEITRCGAVGKQWENCTPGSRHKVVPHPEGETPSNHKGVWIMGVSEPVKVLRDEYEPVKLSGMAAIKASLKGI